MGVRRITRRVRRSGEDVRVELTPMIDVVFLLLTFFIFSIVLMVRADVLDVRLPELRSGQDARRVDPITVAVSEDGSLHLNAEPIELAQVAERIKALRAEEPDAPLLLAVDVHAEAGVMIELADTLVGADLADFSIIGRRVSDDDTPAPAPDPAPAGEPAASQRP